MPTCIRSSSNRAPSSRKPDCTRERIERLVTGPYLELFARGERPGWTAWGDEYDAQDDFAKSVEEGYRAIRQRVAAGGPKWAPK
jgi:N6-adenosine-specific RNA methylase IME4